MVVSRFEVTIGQEVFQKVCDSSKEWFKFIQEEADRHGTKGLNPIRVKCGINRYELTTNSVVYDFTVVYS